MEGLGINPLLLGTQIINFLIMVVVLKLLIYKPLTKALDGKKKKEQEDVLMREKLLQEVKKLEEQRQKMLAEAREEARKVVQDAIKEAKRKTTELLSDERAQLAEQEKKMRNNMYEEKKALLDEATKKSVHLGILMAEKLLHQKMGRDVQRKLLEQSLTEIKNMK